MAEEEALVGAAANRQKIRVELEALLQDFNILIPPLDLALAREDAVPMSVHQVKGTIKSLEEIKEIISELNSILRKQETDEPLRHSDTKARHSFKKQWDTANEKASALKCTYEVAKKIQQPLMTWMTREKKTPMSAST